MAVMDREKTEETGSFAMLGLRSLQAKFLLLVVPLVLLAILLVFGYFEYTSHRTAAEASAFKAGPGFAHSNRGPLGAGLEPRRRANRADRHGAIGRSGSHGGFSFR